MKKIGIILLLILATNVLGFSNTYWDRINNYDYLGFKKEFEGFDSKNS